MSPFRYRGYCYDTETGLYYLNSRYYDPVTQRFVNADGLLATGYNITGTNLFAYCGNNPINRFDPTGKALWHWVLGAAVVAACVVATVATCGGSLALATTSIGIVAGGDTAFSTATTVAAAATIGAATVYGASVLNAAHTSKSIDEFNEHGNWETVVDTATGAILAGVDAFTTSKVSSATIKKSENLGKPFNPNGNKVQIGVDPRTITPSKDLSNLDLQRLRNAEIYGRDQAISVYRNGVVEDGNHRLKNALTYKRSIDISIFD